MVSGLLGAKPCPSCPLHLCPVGLLEVQVLGGAGGGVRPALVTEEPHPWGRQACGAAPLTATSCPLSPGVVQEPQGQILKIAGTAQAARPGTQRCTQGPRSPPPCARPCPCRSRAPRGPPRFRQPRCAQPRETPLSIRAQSVLSRPSLVGHCPSPSPSSGPSLVGSRAACPRGGPRCPGPSPSSGPSLVGPQAGCPGERPLCASTSPSSRHGLGIPSTRSPGRGPRCTSSGPSPGLGARPLRLGLFTRSRARSGFQPAPLTTGLFQGTPLVRGVPVPRGRLL